MNVEEFLSIAQMFASEDGSRQSLGTSFRYGHHLFVTDAKIALIKDASGLDADEIGQTTDAAQRNVGNRLIKEHIERICSAIDSDKYCEYDLCDIGNAVCELFASIEPEMMSLRANSSDPDDLDNDGMPDSVRFVHDRYSVVIMANPARSVISGYYASLIAGLVTNFGPVTAYADKNDANAEMYFRADNWSCILMPRKTYGYDDGSHYLYTSIADARTGELVHRRGSTININALRFNASRHKQTATVTF